MPSFNGSRGGGLAHLPGEMRFRTAVAVFERERRIHFPQATLETKHILIAAKLIKYAVPPQK